MSNLISFYSWLKWDLSSWKSISTLSAKKNKKKNKKKNVLVNAVSCLFEKKLHPFFLFSLNIDWIQKRKKNNDGIVDNLKVFSLHVMERKRLKWNLMRSRDLVVC